MNNNIQKKQEIEAELLKLTKFVAENSAQLNAVSLEIQQLQEILNELNRTGLEISARLEWKMNELMELYRENLKLPLVKR